MRLAAREPALADATADPAESLAALRRDQSVTVAGPDALAAMIALCRAGFERVSCVDHAVGGGETSDVLLIVGRLPAEDLAALLERTRRALRPGGVLVVEGLTEAGPRAL